MAAGYLQPVKKLLASARSSFTKQSRAEDKARYIPTLDGWRAVAILMVIAYHAGAGFYGLKEFFAVSPTRFGSWGVPVFFALSGLLITKLLLEEFDRSGRISLKSFYIRRAFRILPAATLYILTLAALGLLVSRTELASSLFFFRNYLPESLAGFIPSTFGRWPWKNIFI